MKMKKYTTNAYDFMITKKATTNNTMYILQELHTFL